MNDKERLEKRAERLRQINVKLKAAILGLKTNNKRLDAQIDRLEEEVKSLVEIIEPGSWK